MPASRPPVGRSRQALTVAFGPASDGRRARFPIVVAAWERPGPGWTAPIEGARKCLRAARRFPISKGGNLSLVDTCQFGDATQAAQWGTLDGLNHSLQEKHS
jgi:hypothetical protein